MDARSLAAAQGLPPVAANLILLGFAAGQGRAVRRTGSPGGVMEAKTPERFRETSLRAFQLGLAAALAASEPDIPGLNPENQNPPKSPFAKGGL